MIAAQWSLYAVEAALRVTYGDRTRLKDLIDQANCEDRISSCDRERLHATRELRNAMTHAVSQETWTIGMSAGVLT